MPRRAGPTPRETRLPFDTPELGTYIPRRSTQGYPEVLTCLRCSSKERVTRDASLGGVVVREVALPRRGRIITVTAAGLALAVGVPLAGAAPKHHATAHPKHKRTAAPHRRNSIPRKD